MRSSGNSGESAQRRGLDATARGGGDFGNLFGRGRYVPAALVLAALGGGVRAETPAPVAEPKFSAEDVEFFEKKVRPTLVKHCGQCHAGAEPKAGLRLDGRQFVLTGGDSGPSAVPGDPDKSLLIEAVRYVPDGYQMPPKGKMPADEIAALEEWVRRGLPWPAGEKVAAAGPHEFNLAERAKHWSFRPLTTPAVPPVAAADWPRDPLDRFVLAKLEAAGIAPATEATKSVWLRRVTFGLTGLPPTPEEIAAFLADDGPRAHETVVDRLLASPHYAERWARHWLDLARFAETYGHEFDFEIPHAWRYRDYLVRAFEADLPYDRFALEQLAGDLLPEPRRDPRTGRNESLLGTGFLLFGEAKHSPVDVRQDECERVDNQLDVLSKTFLGLTITCARCHDHKFDPITAKDYHALAGFLQSSRYQQAFLDAPAPRQALLDSAKGHRAAAEVALRQADAASGRDAVPAAWRAAWGVLGKGEPPRRSVPAGRPDVLVMDFEGDDYAGWIAEGDAFGTRPNRAPLPDYQGDVEPVGKGFVNTHSALHGEARRVGDGLTGRLLSPPFTIERTRLRFLIGGGNHPDKTAVRLLLDDKPVRSATGRNDNRLRPAEFAVEEFAGKVVRLEILDRVGDAWGNIGADEFVQTDEPLDPAEVRLHGFARLHGAEVDDVRRLLKLFEEARRTPDHPLHPFLTAFARAADPLRGPTAEELSAALPAGDRAAPVVPAGFGDGWSTTGEAFDAAGPAPFAWSAERGNFILPERPDSGRVGGKTRGGLRGPTFTIDQPKLYFRVAGKRTRVRLILESLQLIQNPIYGELSQNIDHDLPTWREMNLAMWLGRRAYLEFEDEGDGWISVGEVLASNGPRPVDPPAFELFAAWLQAGTKTPETSWAERTWGVVTAARAEWRQGGLDGTQAGVAVGLVRERRRLLQELAKHGFERPTGDAASSRERAAAEAALAKLPEPERAPALLDGTGEDEFLLIRGNPKNVGPAVPRRFLDVFGAEPIPADTVGSGRLAFAQMLVDPAKNPLFLRVMVNRLWHHHFGAGLVRSTDDFGHMGQLPTHPELLDFLAGEWRREGLTFKALHKRLVLSATYRQSSKADPAADEKDPQNLLRHKMPVRRLEAEAIRDAILATSGRLDPRRFGPSVAPHLTPFMSGRGRPGRSGPLDGDGRRSLYLGVRRNFLSPFLLAFDYPVPFTAIGRRTVSNVPAQALTLLNNPFVQGEADRFAERAFKDVPPGTPGEVVSRRLGRMYLLAYGREPTPAEQTAAVNFLEARSPAGRAADDPNAWKELAHVMFNVKEFIFLP